jgi:hypothetical protein
MSRVSELGKVATANRLSDGTVVFFTQARRWSEDIDAAAVAVGADAVAALSAEGQQAEAANHVTGSYLIAVERHNGRVVPVHIRERIRSHGPTVNYGRAATG